MWSSSPANRPPTAARPSVSHRGRTARTIVSTGLRAPGASARFFLDSERLSVSVCFLCFCPLLLHVSSQQDDYTDASISSSPILDAATTTTTTEDPSFITARGSSFFIGDGPGDTTSFSYKTECQSKEELAGSYHYTAIGATPPEVQARPAGRSSSNGETYIHHSVILWTGKIINQVETRPVIDVFIRLVQWLQTGPASGSFRHLVRAASPQSLSFKSGQKSERERCN